MSNAPQVSEIPGKHPDPVELLGDLEAMDTDQKKYNHLRDLFLEEADVDEYIQYIDTDEEIDLTKKQLKWLKNTLNAFKVYLKSYLVQTAARIGRFDEKNREIAEKMESSELTEEEIDKLSHTRKRVAKAMQIVEAPRGAKGKSLREVAVNADELESRYREFLEGLDLSIELKDKLTEMVSDTRYREVVALVKKRNPEIRLLSRANILMELMDYDEAELIQMCETMVNPMNALVYPKGKDRDKAGNIEIATPFYERLRGKLNELLELMLEVTKRQEESLPAIQSRIDDIKIELSKNEKLRNEAEALANSGLRRYLLTFVEELKAIISFKSEISTPDIEKYRTDLKGIVESGRFMGNRGDIYNAVMDDIRVLLAGIKRHCEKRILDNKGFFKGSKRKPFEDALLDLESKKKALSDLARRIDFKNKKASALGEVHQKFDDKILKLNEQIKALNTEKEDKEKQNSNGKKEIMRIAKEALEYYHEVNGLEWTKGFVHPSIPVLNLTLGPEGEKLRRDILAALPKEYALPGYRPNHAPWCDLYTKDGRKDAKEGDKFDRWLEKLAAGR